MVSLELQALTKDDDRFWAQVDKAGPVPSSSPELGQCWIWTGSLTYDGYARFSIHHRWERAYKWAFERWCKSVSPGLEIDHVCGNRLCVRLDHLEEVTHAENVKRASKAQQTHCVKGHELNEENTHVRRNGTRRCRLCDAERHRLARARRKA